MKRFLTLTSALAIAVTLGACSSDDTATTKHHDVAYVQTHQNDDVTKLNATMHQKFGNKDRMGHVKFTERDAGLSMDVELYDTHPNTEYTIGIYELKNCKAGKCTQVREDMDMPTLKSDAKGKINETFMLSGLTAAELDNTKISLMRPDANGDVVEVGHGQFKERWLF